MHWSLYSRLSFIARLLYLINRESAIIERPVYDLRGLDLSYGTNSYRERAPPDSHERPVRNNLWRNVLLYRAIEPTVDSHISHNACILINLKLLDVENMKRYLFRGINGHTRV